MEGRPNGALDFLVRHAVTTPLTVTLEPVPHPRARSRYNTSVTRHRQACPPSRPRPARSRGSDSIAMFSVVPSLPHPLYRSCPSLWGDNLKKMLPLATKRVR